MTLSVELLPGRLYWAPELDLLPAGTRGSIVSALSLASETGAFPTGALEGIIANLACSAFGAFVVLFLLKIFEIGFSKMEIALSCFTGHSSNPVLTD